MVDIIESCKKAITDVLNGKITCSGHDGLNSLMIPVSIHKSDELGNVKVNFPPTD